MRVWYKEHAHDFYQQDTLLPMLKKCLTDTGITDRFSLALELRKVIGEAEKGPLNADDFQRDADEPAPTPILPIAPRTRFGALHVHPLELARQMSLIDQDLFMKIETWEFFRQAWNKENKQGNAPNIHNAIVRFNVTSRWIQAELLCEEDLKTRVLVLKHFLKVAAVQFDLRIR